jgi:hypothetical protein
METEGSLSCSLELAIGPYHKPDASTLCLSFPVSLRFNGTYKIQIKYNLVQIRLLHLGFRKDSQINADKAILFTV